MRLGRRAARTENHGRKLPQKSLIAILRRRVFPRQQVRQVSRARDPAGKRQVFGNIDFRPGHMHAEFLDRLSYGQAVCIQDRGRHGIWAKASTDRSGTELFHGHRPVGLNLDYLSTWRTAVQSFRGTGYLGPASLCVP